MDERLSLILTCDYPDAAAATAAAAAPAVAAAAFAAAFAVCTDHFIAQLSVCFTFGLHCMLQIQFITKTFAVDI